MGKSVYFAGSIRGGRQDAALYARIIAYLKGRGFQVLTEYVGLSSLSAMGEQDLTEKQIWERDMSWLIKSDIVVAECTAPSLGVGYELGRARDLGKEILALYDRDRCRLSAMLAGDGKIRALGYGSKEELFAVLDRNL